MIHPDVARALGAEPQGSESGNPIIGLEEDRPIAIYHLPLPIGHWEVVCHITSLKNFLLLEIFSLILLRVIVYLVLKPSSKVSETAERVLTAIASPFVLWNSKEFLGLGGTKPLLTLLFILEIILFSVLLIASLYLNELRKAIERLELKVVNLNVDVGENS